MPAAVRRTYVTVGVALVGASVISATPIEPSQFDMRIANADVRLAASVGDIANVPANLFNLIASLPANEVQALDRFADAMLATGSWDVWSPTNVFGFDAVDQQRLKAIVDLLIPFPPVSSVIGDWLSVWSQANLPMNAGCAALPGACPDPAALLNNMFNVSVLQLFTGYTFPEVVNPFDGSHPEWSGQHVELDPFEPVTAVIDYFLAPPSGVETDSPEQALATVAKFAQSLWVGFYPFVQNSEWFNPDTTGFAYLFRPLAPILCQDCDPQNPYDNPWLYENYDPHYSSSTSSSAQLVTLDVTDFGLAGTENSQPVQNLGNQPANGATTQGGSATADVLNKRDVPTAQVEQSIDPGTEAKSVDDEQGGLSAGGSPNAPDSNTAALTMPSGQEGKDGNTVVPGGSSGGKHRMPGGGGLSDTLKSAQDKINTTISKVTNSLKGDATKSREDTTSSRAEAGNIGK